MEQEIKNGTYTIPEGFTVKIEDGKIIVKKEDEDIRREIIKFLTDSVLNKIGGTWKGSDIDKVKQSQKYTKWVAYLERHTEPIWTEEDEYFVKHILPRILKPEGWSLEQVEADKGYLKEFINRQKNKFIEKQKEQEPTVNIDNFKSFMMQYLQDAANRKTDSEIEADTDKWAKKLLNLIEVKEQKPAEWSDSVAKEMFIKALERAVEQTKKGYELTDCDRHSWWEDFKAYSGIKPAEWSEEDDKLLNYAISMTDDAQVKRFLESLRFQPKQECSEKDEKTRKWLISYLENKLDDDEFTAGGAQMMHNAIAWLKKTEWGEEDETALDDLMWCIEQAKKSTKDENDMGNIWFAENWVKNRLKSLRPQSHWKPSEEQMKVFLKANPINLMPEELGVYHSLYNDLKKL